MALFKKSNKILHLLNFISQLNNELDFYYFLGFVIDPIDWVIKLVSMRKWTKYASNHTNILLCFYRNKSDFIAKFPLNICWFTIHGIIFRSLEKQSMFFDIKIEDNNSSEIIMQDVVKLESYYKELK